tara:strand:+ start:8955 stop:9281 length:327 start_codon:yes stop_codon:yes gene_type:complete
MDISYNYIYTLSACEQVYKINNIIKNDKLINIYKNLFILLNTPKYKDNLLIKQWIEYLQCEIDNFLNILDECDNFIKNSNQYNIINLIDNKQIESVYLVSLMKHKDFI